MVSEILTTLVSGITTFGTGFARGFGEVLKAVMLQSTATTTDGVTTYTYGTALSDTGKIIVAFAAVSLAIGVSYIAVKFVCSLGATRP